MDCAGQGHYIGKRKVSVPTCQTRPKHTRVSCHAPQPAPRQSTHIPVHMKPGTSLYVPFSGRRAWCRETSIGALPRDSAYLADVVSPRIRVQIFNNESVPVKWAARFKLVSGRTGSDRAPFPRMPLVPTLLRHDCSFFFLCKFMRDSVVQAMNWRRA